MYPVSYPLQQTYANDITSRRKFRRVAGGQARHILQTRYTIRRIIMYSVPREKRFPFDPTKIERFGIGRAHARNIRVQHAHRRKQYNVSNVGRSNNIKGSCERVCQNVAKKLKKIVKKKPSVGHRAKRIIGMYRGAIHLAAPIVHYYYYYY